VGRQSGQKRQRRFARQQEQRLLNPKQRYPVNTEYSRPTSPASPSEEYLRDVCDRTFLSLWSYPNLYHDQDGGSSLGKEVCDLLVVFEQHVIIFSDKQCDFPDSGDLDVDWSRWYRRAIEKSTKQLWGAERWIRSHPDRLFLDAGCTKKFPLNLAIGADTVFHRVLVAHGASARCARELGGSGSLMVSSGVVGDDHVLKRADGGVPFMVGQVDPKKGYVHCLDDTTFDILLQTLDTLADFVAYLTKKDRFIGNGHILSAAGEEELLAYYLTHLNENKEYDFVFEGEFNGVSIDEGFWRDFVNSPQRKAQLKANRVSYLWDDVIERFTRHFLQGTSQFLFDTSLASHELTLRFFAREPRVRRRMLASAILGMIETTPPTLRRLRVVAPSRAGDPHFVLLLLPQVPSVSYEENRMMRLKFLEICCQVVKLDYPDALDVIGFASETAATSADGRSEDAVYFDARQWNDEIAAQAARDKVALKILTPPTTTMLKSTEYDYPI
jgi:hypothetical protein